MLFNIILKGVTPIIAHPERYRIIQQDYLKIKNFIKIGCLIQIDAGSILGLFGEDSLNCAKDIIESGYGHILGSDAHNQKKRNFCLDKALEVAKELIGDYANLLVKDHPENVIEGKKINIDDYRRKIMDNKENNNNWVKRIFK